MTEVENVSFKKLSEVCSILGSLMESVMDENSTALIVGSTGEITFTRSGLKVLSESCCSHPLAKLISNAAIKYSSETGNDCNVFLFLLKEIMLYIKCTAQEEFYFRSKLSGEISFFISILPVIFKTIHGNSIDQYLKSEIDIQKFNCDLKSVLISFMQSKFSFSVSKVLSSLVFQLIKCSNEWFYFNQTLDYLISHFDIVCTKVIAPFSESLVVEGFTINHHMTSPDMVLENTSYIMVEDLSQNLLVDTCWEINANSLNCKLSNYYGQCEQIVNYFKCRNINLILSSSAASETLKSTCTKYNVILIDRLTKEEFDNIALCSNILVLSNLNNGLEAGNVGTLKSLKHLTCYKSTFISIKTVVNPLYFVPHTFFLCSHLESQWKEYYIECLNSLKVAKMWFYSLNKNRELYNASQYKSKLEVKIDPELTSLLQDSIFLHQISSKKDLNNKNKNNSNLSCNNNCFDLILLALPVGLWDLLFQDILDHLKKLPMNSFSNICKALNQAYKKFLCLKFNVPFPCSSAQLKRGYLNFQDTMRNKINPFIEPITTKEILVYHLLELILQLLKIEQVIKSK